MKRILIMVQVILFLFITGCTVLKNIQAGFNPTESKIIPFRDIEIKTSDGIFFVTDIKLIQDFDECRVEGHITNSTKINWANTVFKIKLSSGISKEYHSPIAQGEKIRFNVSMEKEIDDNEKVSVEFVGGDYVLMTKPTLSNDLQYSDSNLNILFIIRPDAIVFGIENKTQSPIKLNWDNFSFVDIENHAHRLIHSSVKLIDSEKQQTTTIIPPMAKIVENVYPPDYIDRTGSQWIFNPLFPKSFPERLSIIGKTFSFFMPIEINGEVKNYNFIFKIAGGK